MEDTAINNLLQQYNIKLEEARVLNLQSWVLNYKCFETLQTQKVQSKLTALAGIKIVAIVLGILWVFFLGMLLYATGFNNIYFSISTIVVMLFTLFAIAVYIKTYLVPAFNGFCIVIRSYIDIIRNNIPPGPFGSNTAPQCILMCER